MKYTFIESPIGPLFAAGDDRGLSCLLCENEYEPDIKEGWEEDAAFFKDVAEQLNAYFSGDRTEFDLKLNFRGTEFQNEVWRELLRIPYGRTTSYGEMATRIGKPKAVRAVGAANGRNPIGIIIPCHRVIGKTGKLVGFGGGLDAKEFLLALETRHAQLELPL
jgi:methylated-DNA-[protein]-cysteine S-methyltransferase